MSLFRLLAPLVALGLLAGCGSVTGGRPPRGTPVPVDAPATQIVFQVTRGAGGLTPVDHFLGLRPEVTVYGDGTAYVLPDDEENRSFPGRPLAFVRGHVPRAALESLARRATTDLFTTADYGDARISDANSTAVRFRPGDTPARAVAVYALDYTDSDLGLTVEQLVNRHALRTLADDVYGAVDLPDGDPQPWTPARVDVTRARSDRMSDPAAPWPGPAPSTFLRRTTERRGECGVLGGAEAHKVWAAAREHGTTNWTVGPLIVRALLPGEKGCA